MDEDVALHAPVITHSLVIISTPPTKEKAKANDAQPKEKARASLLLATLAIANPNNTPVPIVAATITMLVPAINGLQMKQRHLLKLTNKQIKIFSSMRLPWNFLNLSYRSLSPTLHTLQNPTQSVTWGENDTQETIDSDEDTLTAHNNTAEDETKPESQEDNREQDDKHEEDSEYDTVLIDGVLYLAYRNDDGNETTVNSTKELSSHENKVTRKEVYAEQTLTTFLLPSVEPIPYSNGSELTGVPMTASMTPTEQQESSSVEPDWGRTRSKTLQELEDEWQVWEQTPTKGAQITRPRKRVGRLARRDKHYLPSQSMQLLLQARNNNNTRYQS
jgi:hypothetical protein